MQWPVSRNHFFPPDFLTQLKLILSPTSAVSHIMNDDVDTAEEELGKGNSPFHQVRGFADHVQNALETLPAYPT